MQNTIDAIITAC